MKKFILAFALLIGISSFNSIVEAQNINVSINIGRQPAWGPVGYDYAGYYYFPDIDIYYDVNANLFYYMNRGRWISARYLPHSYSHYNLYGLYKVVLNVNQPWRYHHVHYRDYARYKGHRNQIVIRDSRDNRYHASRNNKVVWYADKKTNNQSRPSSNYTNTRPGTNNKNNSNRIESNRNNNKDNKTVRQNNDRNKNNSSSKSSGSSVRSKQDNKTKQTTNSSRDFRMASNTSKDNKRSR